MGRTWRRSVLLLLLLGGATIAARGATVTVLDPGGRPVADALVACLGSEASGLLTDAEGVATVPDDCPAVSCARGGYVPGRAVLEQRAATCRLAAAVRATVALEPSACAGLFQAGLVPVEPAGHPTWARGMEPDPRSGGCVARLRPVAPGTYDVLLNDERGWTCRARIVLSPEDDPVVRATWRPPLELAGTVLDGAGRPVPDIPVRVREPAGGDPPGPGEWRCASRAGTPDTFSSDDGSFRVLVDPARRITIEAGSSWDPDGFAAVEIGPDAAGPVVLRLRD